MSHSILFDAHLCTGCRGCQVACKQWNDLEATETTNTGSHQNPPRLSDKTWLIMKYGEVEQGDHVQFVFGRHACMHCEHPACATACPLEALHKTEEGPVLYRADRCFGCRYCMLACPFEIPTFEWDQGMFAGPWIRKCTMCADRLSVGREPACVQTCPTGALKYGQRDELLAYAHERIEKDPAKYVQHVYGEKEVGGTSVLYISHVPFEQLGLPSDLQDEPISHYAEDAMFSTPIAAVGLTVALTGFYWIVRRRQMMAQKERERFEVRPPKERFP
jgi:formate dehydrogenase iron-sulfur subunit